jgi:prepilin signal peptidase PulO-like enzyme (type II secretory pathway)
MRGPALVLVAAAGLVFGSFVTALSHRLPRGISIARGRSHCPACSHVLTVADLVPVLSWAFNKGACRHCGAKVSARYPAIELLTMALFVTGAYFAADLRHLLLLLAMTPVMVALAVIDLEHRRLPNSLVAVLALLAAAWRFSGDRDLVTAAVAAAVVFVIGIGLDLIARRFFGGPGLGMGDTKLFALAGFALPVGPFLLFIWAAGVFGVFLGLLWRRRSDSPLFPFSPAILLSYWLALTGGEAGFQRLVQALSA